MKRAACMVTVTILISLVLSACYTGWPGYTASEFCRRYPSVQVLKNNMTQEEAIRVVKGCIEKKWRTESKVNRWFKPEPDTLKVDSSGISYSGLKKVTVRREKVGYDFTLGTPSYSTTYWRSYHAWRPADYHLSFEEVSSIHRRDLTGLISFWYSNMPAVMGIDAYGQFPLYHLQELDEVSAALLILCPNAHWQIRRD